MRKTTPSRSRSCSFVTLCSLRTLSRIAARTSRAVLKPLIAFAASSLVAPFFVLSSAISSTTCGASGFAGRVSGTGFFVGSGFAVAAAGAAAGLFVSGFAFGFAVLAAALGLALLAAAVLVVAVIY